MACTTCWSGEGRSERDTCAATRRSRRWPSRACGVASSWGRSCRARSSPDTAASAWVAPGAPSRSTWPARCARARATCGRVSDWWLHSRATCTRTPPALAAPSWRAWRRWAASWCAASWASGPVCAVAEDAASTIHSLLHCRRHLPSDCADIDHRDVYAILKQKKIRHDMMIRSCLISWTDSSKRKNGYLLPDPGVWCPWGPLRCLPPLCCCCCWCCWWCWWWWALGLFILLWCCCWGWNLEAWWGWWCACGGLTDELEELDDVDEAEEEEEDDDDEDADEDDECAAVAAACAAAAAAKAGDAAAPCAGGGGKKSDGLKRERAAAAAYCCCW